MKHKVWTKVVSVIMTVSLMLGLCVTAFASDVTYKATYTKVATKEVYKTVLSDANTEIGKQGLNGNTVQEMYKLLPQVAGILTDAKQYKTIEFYTNTEPEIFANFASFMQSKNATTVTVELLTEYFTENPAQIKDVEDFTNKLNTFIDVFFSAPVNQLIVLALMMGVPQANMQTFFGSLDDVCKSMGIQQEKTFFQVVTAQNGEATAKYVKNIVNAILPDLTNNAMQIIKTLSVPENSSMFYRGITVLVPGLYDLVVKLEGIIVMFAPGLDLAPLKAPLKQASDIVLALPTTGEGENKMFDLEGSIEYIVNDVIAASMSTPNTVTMYTLQAKTGTRGKKILSFNGDGMINFDHINLANVRAAADTTDVFNVIFHYLHKNLNKTGNKALLNTAIGLLPSLGVNLPKEIVNYLTFVLKNNESESVYELYKMLRTATGHDLIFNLVVTNGKGSGKYKMSSSVAIEANKAPEGKVFDKWVVVGDTNVTFSDKTAEKTTITMADRNIEVKAVYKDKAVEHHIIDGTDTTWIPESNKGLTIVVAGSAKDLASVRIDGKVLDPSKYTVKEVNGNTEIVISEAYMQKLGVGNHTVIVDYKDGKCEAAFTVQAKQEAVKPDTVNIPKTGSSLGEKFTKAAVSVVSLSALTAAAVYIKKRKF